MHIMHTQHTQVDDAEATMTRAAADDAPFSALAFKIMTDPFVGTLTFCRVYRCGRGLFVCLPVCLFASVDGCVVHARLAPLPLMHAPTHAHQTVNCNARSGKLEAGTYALNSNKGKKERIGRLMLMHANNRWGWCGVWCGVFCLCVAAVAFASGGAPGRVVTHTACVVTHTVCVTTDASNPPPSPTLLHPHFSMRPTTHTQ
jgi:hypothetical protein